MKNVLRILTGLAFVLLYGITVYAAEDDRLGVDIKTYDGQSVMLKDEEVLYSSIPVTFTPLCSKGENSYSISIDDGETFGAYVITQECVTLYPDDETAPDGRWQIKFKNTEDDREKESATFKVCFDTTPPVITPGDDIPDGWVGEHKRVSFGSSDDISGVARIVSKCGDTVIGHMNVKDEEAFSKQEFFLDLSEAGSGIHTIETTCYDRAGNSSVFTFEYRMDQSVPEISAKGIEDGACMAHTGELHLSAEDEDSDVFIDYVIKRDYKGEIVTTEVTRAPDDTNIGFDEDGVYSVEASSVDSAGNRSKTVAVGFTIDTCAPSVSIEGVSETADIRGAACVSVDVGENIYKGSKVNIILDRTVLGKTENILSSSYDLEADNDIRTVDIKSDGEYELLVSAVDGAGNRSDRSTRFRIDATAPEISVSGIAAGEITNEKPTLRFGAGDLFYGSTIMSYVLEKKEKGGYVITDGKDMVMRSARDHVDITVPQEGQFRLTCTASDRSGNSSSSSVDFTVDYTPPVISDLSGIDNRFFRSFSLPKKIASYVLDATKVKANAYINDEKISDSDVIIEEGKYVLTILAEDEASNVSEGSATFIVDHTSPQIVLGGFDRDGNISRGSMITVSLLEEGDTLKSVRFNDRDIAVSDNTAHIAVNEYGNYRIAVTAEDPAGNITDTEINSSCYMYPSAFEDFVRTEKTITASAPAKNDIDYRGLAVGLISILSGTAGLAYRSFLRD